MLKKNGRLNSQGQADSPVVPRDTAPVRDPGTESGSGPGTDTRIDSALTPLPRFYTLLVAFQAKARQWALQSIRSISLAHLTVLRILYVSGRSAWRTENPIRRRVRMII